MAEGVNVRVGDPLRKFIEFRCGPDGLYENASEYIRDLIRRDYEREESLRQTWLKDQLQPGMAAHEDEFIPFDVEKIIDNAKARKHES